MISAPIRFNGVIIRAIGLEFKESSPDREEEKLWPARIPESSLVVVPLFPAFSVSGG